MRFKPNVNTALDAFKHSKLQFRDIAEDSEVFNHFIQKMLRYIKDADILLFDRFNWNTIIGSIWGSIKKDIRLVFPSSDENENLDVYMIVVEKKYLLFYDYIRDQQRIRDQLYIFRSFNKPYFNYDCEKPREC